MRVTHEAAVALSMNFEPGPENVHQRPEDAAKAALFDKRLAATDRRFSKTNIELAEFAAFVVEEVKWVDLPTELAQLSAIQRHKLVVETKEQRQDRRLGNYEKEYPAPKLHGRLANGVGKLAEAEGVSRQAYSEDIWQAVERRTGRRR